MYPVEAVHLLNRMGMALSNQGHHQAALVVLARALRKTLKRKIGKCPSGSATTRPSSETISPWCCRRLPEP